jgi:hypothetical protein
VDKVSAPTEVAALYVEPDPVEDAEREAHFETWKQGKQ